jgi:disulfide bond formation protein DsbB
MNKTLKWILIVLGILLGLALIAAVVFQALGMSHLGYSLYGVDRYDRFGSFDRYYERMPMMGMFPMVGFSLLRGGFGLGILALAVIGVVLLVRNGHAAKPAAVPTVEAPAAPARTCAKCGSTLEAGWVACPHCGKKQ